MRFLGAGTFVGSPIKKQTVDFAVEHVAIQSKTAVTNSFIVASGTDNVVKLVI